MAYTTNPADNETIANLPGDIREVTTLVTDHTGAASAAHEASAISYGAGTVETALNTTAGHEANQNNPHNVTAAQVGAVALADAVTTITAGKIVKRDSNGKVAGDITGNAATASKLQTARTINGVAFDGSANINISAPANGGNAATVGGKTFTWNDPGGTPSYLWGGSDGVNMTVVPPSRLNVNYANSANTANWASSAGNADTVDGFHFMTTGDSGEGTFRVYIPLLGQWLLLYGWRAGGE